MLLTFSKKQFADRIITGKKIHTIREDNGDRWKVGRSIQFWMGNPRNVRNNPYQFGIGAVNEIKRIVIENNDNSGKRILISTGKHSWKELNAQEINELAINDGFNDTAEFWEWFNKDITGKIIYWEGFSNVILAKNK